MDVTHIVELVLTVILTILTGVVVPYIKSKVEADKFDKILDYTAIAVEAAEKIYDCAGMGEAKKVYVQKFLANHGLKLDTDVIDAIIESTVYNLTKHE